MSLARHAGTWGVGNAGVGPRMLRDEPWSDWAPVAIEVVDGSPLHVASGRAPTCAPAIPTIYDRPTVVAVTTPRDVAPTGGRRLVGERRARRRAGGSVVQISPPGRTGISLSRAGRPGTLAARPLRVPRRDRAARRVVADGLPDPARLRGPSGRVASAGTGRHRASSPAHDRPDSGRHSQTKADPMTQSQTLRTLGAGALGALIVAIAALSVRTGPVSGAPAADDPGHAHDHGLGDRQGHGRPRRRARLPRRHRQQADGQGGPRRRREGDDRHHRRAQGARHRRRGHPDDQPQPLPAVRQQLAGRRSSATRSASRSRSPFATSTRRATRSTPRRRRARPTSTASRSRSPTRSRPRTTRGPRRSRRPGPAPRRWRPPATCRSARSSRSPTRPRSRRSTTTASAAMKARRRRRTSRRRSSPARRT